MKLGLIIIVILYACYIGYRISLRLSRLKDSNNRPGFVTAGYVILVYLSMCLLSFPFVGICISGLYAHASHDKYDAIITSVRTYMDEDDDRRKTLMHTPTVELTFPDEKYIEQELNIASGDPYTVGDLHPVTYSNSSEQLSSGSLSSFLLLIGGLIMALFLLGYVIIGFTYAYDIPIGITGMGYTAFFFIYIFMPLGMLGMNAGMIYYVVRRLLYGYKSDQPVWVLFLVGFFILVLTLAKIGIVKKLLNSKGYL